MSLPQLFKKLALKKPLLAVFVVFCVGTLQNKLFIQEFYV